MVGKCLVIITKVITLCHIYSNVYGPAHKCVSRKCCFLFHAVISFIHGNTETSMYILCGGITLNYTGRAKPYASHVQVC